MSPEHSSRLDQLIAETGDIISPPLIYNRLNDAVNHPRTSIKDIAQIISEDPGLTARILKLANSPFYGSTKIDSISRAVTLLGTREIRDISLALSVVQCFPEMPEDLFSLQDHWRHSIACGVMARNIAIFLREPSIERFFVAGILHDIGQMVLCAKMPDITLQILKHTEEQPQALCSAEYERFNFNHAELGGKLLNSWGIPANISELVRLHHTPSESCDFQRDVTIIHLADLICQALAYGSNSEIHVTRIDSKAYDGLNLPLGEIETIVNQSDRQLEEIFPILLEAK